MDNYECGGFTFNSNFDSGNLDRIEIIKKPLKDVKSEIIPTEFNLYTKPDCGGTIYENGNRTWFFFGVRGGESRQVVKFNVMNLNRQAKLYSQGMYPVYRVGYHGKWDRIKDKPTYVIENDNFILNFIHRVPDDPMTLIFYAFTYPFTYGDLIDYLIKLDKKFGRTEYQFDLILNQLTVKAVVDTDKKDIIKESVINVEHEFEDAKHVEETNSNSEYDKKANEEYDINFSDCIDKLKRLPSPALNVNDTKSNEITKQDVIDAQNDIYYYREVVIHSLQGRPVELLTISSFTGITNVREPILKNLFPNQYKKRCHSFNSNKKIIFLSSRVHPGETPASFVLNGFINFLLDRKSVIAATLRNMYVFKIIPFLNPDGVYNGMYRSDTLGQNLNRVYLSPKLDTQPTIYAARKLILFYNFGYEKDEDELIDHSKLTTVSGMEEMLSNRNDEQKNPEADIISNKDEIISTVDPVPLKDTDSDSVYLTSSSGDETTLNPNIDKSESNVSTTTIPSPVKTNENKKPIVVNRTNQIFNKSQSVPPPSTQTSLTVLQQQHIHHHHHHHHHNHNHASIQKTVPNAKKHEFKFGLNKFTPLSSTTVTKKPVRSKSLTYERVKSAIRSNPSIKKETQPDTNTRVQKQLYEQLKRTDRMHLHQKKDYVQEKDTGGKNVLCDEQKGVNMFLYIDFHGHASKKGVFMYGNHLPNVQEAVDCMLLPRLMSMNCHHFHFEACNFSERNMYLKGKRDGLSKEGSGRVAIYKATGLIKSYTLEGNYNTGKIVNILPPRGKEFSSKIVSLNPPKYTPAIFEEVGRALGPSILDLTNSNSNSRIGNSDFRTMQGLRNALKFEIDRSFSRNTCTPKARPKSRRVKFNVPQIKSTQIDALKENKAFYDMPWDLLNHQHLSISQHNLHNQQHGTILSVSTVIQPSTTSTVTSTTMSSASKVLNSKCLKKGQTTFGKKETSISNKTIKIASDTALLVSDCETKTYLKMNDQQIQVPRKRIKVAATQLHKVASLTENFISNYPISNDSLLVEHSSTSSLNSRQTPCCSLSLAKQQTNPKKLSTTSTLLTNQSQSQTLIKSFDRMRAGVVDSNDPKVRRSSVLPKKGNIDGATKIKKKRTLKTEIGLKRKKSRVKTVWHSN